MEDLNWPANPRLVEAVAVKKPAKVAKPLADTLKARVATAPATETEKKYGPFQLKVETANGFRYYKLGYPQGHYNEHGSQFLALNLSGGGLNCCGMGVMGGFYVYPMNKDVGSELVIPTAEVIKKYMTTILNEGYFYAEMLGIMNGPQWNGREFFEVLFSFEEIHQTTNKNHGGPTPMRVLKFNRHYTVHRWLASDEGVNRYRAWVAKQYPNYKGAV